MTAGATITQDELSSLIAPRERAYLGLVVIASLLIYGLLFLVLRNAVGGDKGAAGGAVLLIYVPIIAAVYFLSHLYAMGRLRGNGIRVTASQLPVVNRLVIAHSQALGLKEAPAAYVVQAGGLLNAFATKFFIRQFVVLYSDVVALAMEEGEGALGFVVAHELAHIRRGHLRFRWLTLPGRLVPYLGSAYSRACEYTCDRFAAKCEPKHAVSGLLVLAAGRSLYRLIDATSFAAQVDTEAGFWVRRAELASSHPLLPKRVAALLDAGIPRPTLVDAPHS